MFSNAFRSEFGRNHSKQGFHWQSMGVLLYVLIAGFPPFDGRDFREIRFKVLRTTVRFPYHVSIGRKIFCHFSSECLQSVEAQTQKKAF